MKKKSFNSSLINIMEDIDIGILILDSIKGNIIFQNSYFNELTGEHSKFVIDHILECARLKKKFKIHNDIETEEELIFGFSIYPVRKKKNRSIALVTNISSKKIYMDSKCRKNYYNKLSRYSLEIAHEVGNPLTSVIMTLQVLSKNLKKWEQNQQKEYIETSIIELKRLSNFTKRLRNLSRNFEMDIKTIFLKEIIDRVILQNKIRLDQKSIKIIEKIDMGTRVNIDDEAFSQIIFNLILNSIEILKDNSTIRFIVDEIDDFFVKLVYSNNGPYIEDSILEKIFLPSFSTKEGGSGIGLDLSLKLMTNMGGTIKAENCENETGVKFTLYIPVVEANQNGN